MDANEVMVIMFLWEKVHNFPTLHDNLMNVVILLKGQRQILRAFVFIYLDQTKRLLNTIKLT